MSERALKTAVLFYRDGAIKSTLHVVDPDRMGWFEEAWMNPTVVVKESDIPAPVSVFRRTFFLVGVTRRYALYEER